MSTDPYSIYFEEVKNIEDKKASLVWNLMMIEQHLDDSTEPQACQAMLQVANDLEEVVGIVSVSPEISAIPEAAIELKQISDFAREFEVVVRSRSWASMCRAFDPKSGLDSIKYLKNMLTRTRKSRRKRGGSRDRNATDRDVRAQMASLRDRIRLRAIENNYLARDIPRTPLDMNKLRLT